VGIRGITRPLLYQRGVRQLPDAAFAFSTTHARLLAECDIFFARESWQANVEIGITKSRAAVSEGYWAPSTNQGAHCIGGFAFLRRGVSLLNGDGQLALQSGLFVCFLPHLSHPQFKSFSTALDAGSSRKLRNQKNKKKLDILLRF